MSSDTTEVTEAVVLAQQIWELRQHLKKLEKAMSLEEYVKYVDETGKLKFKQTTPGAKS